MIVGGEQACLVDGGRRGRCRGRGFVRLLLTGNRGQSHRAGGYDELKSHVIPQERCTGASLEEYALRQSWNNAGLVLSEPLAHVEDRV